MRRRRGIWQTPSRQRACRRARGAPGGRGTGICAFWEQVLEQKTPTDVGCPYTCPYHDGPLPEYSEDMCARSVELFDRAVHIAVNQWWTEADCQQVAEALNKVCGVYG